MLYRPDADEARKRLTTWWRGGDIGRPVLQMSGPRETPWEEIPALPQPPGWITGYSTRDFGYRLNVGLRQCLKTEFYGEAFPCVSPDLAPNCLALFLGCQGVEMPGTVWCEPFPTPPEPEQLAFRRDNFYWDFSWRLGQEFVRQGRGKFMIQFPDLIEGLDTLAAMRGSQELLLDLIERPEWVHRCLDRITELYFEAYDPLYEQYRDAQGGSIFWAWAPGRMCKLQCDFSAMISPAMFGEFMVPVLRRMTARFDHCMYHWDGPGAIPHHDHLLSLPDLDMLQWTPGAGAAPVWDRKWWPLYHKSAEAGKKLFISVDSLDTLREFKREFGPKLKLFLINLRVKNRAEADQAIAITSD
jgi:5-methyltetrahydrofolate--homocysteine methyltransferase